MPDELSHYYRRHTMRDRDVLTVANPPRGYQAMAFRAEPYTDRARQFYGSDGWWIVARGPAASGDPGSWVMSNDRYATEAEAQAVIDEGLALRPVVARYRAAEAAEETERRRRQAARRADWTAAHGRAPYVCAECGAREDDADVFCVLSDEGEGDHDWVDDEPLDPAFARRLAVHLEQGGMER